MLGVADDEVFSHAAKMTGRDLTLDRYVAFQAAVNLSEAPSSWKELKPDYQEFLRWLQGTGGDSNDHERRRHILLTLTQGRTGANAQAIRQIANDAYSTIRS